MQWMEENVPDYRLTLIEGERHSLFLRVEVGDTMFKSIVVQFHARGSYRICKTAYLMTITARRSKHLKKPGSCHGCDHNYDHDRTLPASPKNNNSKPWKLDCQNYKNHDITVNDLNDMKRRYQECLSKINELYLRLAESQSKELKNYTPSTPMTPISPTSS
ncbi:1079_t:CDS:2, partial [Acaulospora morrowiae]